MAYARQSQSAGRSGNKLEYPQHVLKFLKTTSIGNDLKERLQVSLEFVNVENGFCTGTISGADVSMVDAKKLIKQKVDTVKIQSFTFSPEQCETLQNIPPKTVISKFQEERVRAGWHVHIENGKVDICSNSMKNVNKAHSIIRTLAINHNGSKFQSSGSNRSVGQPILRKIDASIEELRYLKAINRDKNVSKEYKVVVRVKDSSRVIQVSGSDTERVHDAEKQLKRDIEQLSTSTITYPKEQIWIQCLKTVKHADIVQALKSSSVRAGWDFKEHEFVVCGANKPAAEKAAGAIENLAKQMAYPDKGRLSNAQLKSCETDKWFEVEDKLKEDNVHIRIDHSLTQIVFVMPSKQRDTAIIRRLQNFFDSHTQQKVTKKLSADEAKLLKLNKTVVEDGCQLLDADKVFISFFERSYQLESCSTKSLDHAQQKLAAFIQGICQTNYPVDKTALIAWLQSDAGRQKLEDLSSLTCTINKIKINEQTETSSAKPTLQVVDGDISTITANGILTGRGILQEAVEKAYRKKLQPGINLVQLDNKASRYVYHAEIGVGDKGSTVLVLKKSVIEALKAFSDCGVETIALPAIGTGNLELPPSEVANALVSAVKEFVKSNPQTSLQTVTLVSYQSPIMTKIFKAAVQPIVPQQASVEFLGLDEDSVKKAVKCLKDEMDDGYGENSESEGNSGSGGNSERSSEGNRQEEVDRPPTAHPADVDSDLSDSQDFLDETNQSLDNISLRVVPTSRRAIRDLFFSEKVYQMSSPTRGRFLVINNQHFETPTLPDQEELGDREGSEMDVKNVVNVFKRLSFEHNSVHKDLSSADMLKVIKKETKREEHKYYGMFVLVIMTHGTATHLYGSDGRPINLSDIYDCMSAHNFEYMRGKPKLVILQACSGERMDMMGGFTTDSKKALAADARPPMTSLPAPSASPAVGKYLSTDDMMIMKASFFSYVSTRHRRQGTWFIRALVEALYKHACHRDLQTLFEKQVMKKVRTKSIDTHTQTGITGGQQPTIDFFPTKGRKLYLFPGYDPRPPVTK